MKISVAMTTYCGERYVLQQLQSLLDQERKPDEVIILDDCSKDATAEIVETFIANNNLNNWFFQVNECNLGYVNNFRKALQMTTGDLVFTCDQDDVWYPQKLSHIQRCFEENPQICALACNFNAIGSDGQPIDQALARLPREGLQKTGIDGLYTVDQGASLYSNIAQGCACAYRRELVREYCDLPSTAPMPHDWALNLLAYNRKGLYFLDTPLFGYRIHESNTIGLSTREQVIRNRIPLLQDYERCVEKAASLPQPDKSKRVLERIAKFTALRIRFLKECRFGIWLSGVIRYPDILVLYFFLPYAKDLHLVLSGTFKKNVS